MQSLKRTFSKCSMDTGDALLATKKKLSSSALATEPVLLPRDKLEPEKQSLSFRFPVKLGSNRRASLVLATRVLDDVQDKGDHVSAARLIALVLDYLRDVAHYCNCAVNWSFAQLRQALQSLPFAVTQMQSVVQARLELSWPLVMAVVQKVTDFISDEDIREASIGDLVVFLQMWQQTTRLYEQSVLRASSNICSNLCQFFRDVLQQFKHFLIKRWLQSGRISFPCEFGKKSDSLFLCMECHREHM